MALQQTTRAVASSTGRSRLKLSAFSNLEEALAAAELIVSRERTKTCSQTLQCVKHT